MMTSLVNTEGMLDHLFSKINSKPEKEIETLVTNDGGQILTQGDLFPEEIYPHEKTGESRSLPSVLKPFWKMKSYPGDAAFLSIHFNLRYRTNRFV
jgi:hypothetical protein